MKKLTYQWGVFLSVLVLLIACKDTFLKQPPQGALNESILQSEKGVFAALIGVYSVLDGWSDNNTFGDPYGASGTNWIWGGLQSDDSYKGTDIGDQSQLNPIERYEVLPTSPFVRSKWGNVYNGVARANAVLNLIDNTNDLTEENKLIFRAETQFLRGHYHFEVKKVFNKVPFVDQKASEKKFKVPNDQDIWPLIEADLQFAADNLPETMPSVGRVNKWAAKAMLAKVYMFQGKYSQALPLLNEVIANGMTSDGKKYGLNECYHDNFNAATKNSKEAVFSIQYSVNDGTNGANGGWPDVLNYPFQGGPGACCGFNQPSQNLVNSYKTDQQGLPLLYSFNNEDVKSDQGLSTTQAFTPDQGNLDPRLDWTVGRRGISYLDWGPHPGVAWIRDQSYGGPYSPKKNVYYKSQQGNLSTGAGWAQGPNANNYTIIRFADVLLWAAEAEVEVGDMEKARTYVNQIRTRAKEGCLVENPDGTPAANYLIGTYDSPWSNKTIAQDAVRFERRLELAMEGHRFFDLVRWGVAAETLNEYLRVESTKRQYLQGARFIKGRDEYKPIPFDEIVNSAVNGQPTLQQNPGY
jgi:hypothetical protein